MRTAATVTPKPATPVVSPEMAAWRAAVDNVKRTDPQLKAVRLQRLGLDTREDYGPLFKQFGWSQEQIENFTRFLADLTLRARSQPDVGIDDPAGMTPEQIVASVQTQFGDDVATRFASLQDTIGARFIVNQIVAQTYYTGESFTAEQESQLARIIADASAQPLVKHDIINGYSKTDWARVLTQAESFLSPAQLAALRSRAAQGRADEQWQSARAAGSASNP